MVHQRFSDDQLLAAIDVVSVDTGRCTVRALASHLGVSATAVYMRVVKLEGEGRLVRDPREAGSIRRA